MVTQREEGHKLFSLTKNKYEVLVDLFKDRVGHFGLNPM
jgi:hypothetical protein